jgi:copper chaperone CopZ
MPDDQATTTIRLRVDGMGCDGCVTSVRDALHTVPGVIRAEVDLQRGMAEVEAAPAIEPAALIAAVDAAGYEAASA